MDSSGMGVAGVVGVGERRGVAVAKGGSKVVGVQLEISVHRVKMTSKFFLIVVR
ncbi:MAG: hypothetical protein HYX86_01345 [Chloroflexi bacterium]|nr:hypothetical protein [Chloroflexota bacterium]